MFIYWTKINLFITFFTVVTQDIAPNVYCNKRKLTWYKARDACLNAKGKFIAYETGLGVNVTDLNLTNETDIWTADFARKPSHRERSEKICSFCNLDRGKCSVEVMYGDCDTPRHFVCRNSSTNGLDVFLGRRNSSCPVIKISGADFLYLPSGFYWTDKIVNVITGTTWPPHRISGYQLYLCGAYKNSIGKYFGDCKTKRVSLCNITATTSSYNDSFDKSCFEKHQSTVVQTKTSLKTVTIPTGTTAKRTTGVMTHVTKSIHPTAAVSWEDGRSDKRNVGVTVGLPVGLGIALICGISLSIYIIRRYKKKSDNSNPG